MRAKPFLPSQKWRRCLPALILIWFATGTVCVRSGEKAGNIQLWDTKTSTGENLDSRNGWATVPTDLFTLEKDPLKASSDPGYYGREYAFKGNPVVENDKMVAVFPSATGTMLLYVKKEGPNAAKSGAAIKVAEISPLEHGGGMAPHFGVIRNAGDEVVLEVSFGSNESHGASVIFTFDKTSIVQMKASAGSKGLRITAPIEYGVVPGFVGDDLIFSPSEENESTTVSIPSENLLLGLLKGENEAVVVTWPKADQKLRLNRGESNEGKRSFKSLDIENDGQSIFVAAQSASGIWHKEELNASFLEKDVPLKWKKPFSARWQTELFEGSARTRFAFGEVKREIWRGVPGSYNYPVWFDGDSAVYHLSKKVPPKGDSLIYFVEGQSTPDAISTPVDILKATLGRSEADAILDDAGRRLRTHHRRGASGVRRACTCGCTEMIQAFFEDGQETKKKAEIAEALSDMTFFVESHVARIQEYRKGAEDLIGFLQAEAKSHPDLKAFSENLSQIAAQIVEECEVQRDNMKSPAYAGELVNRTMALTERDDTQNLKAYMDLLKEWRAMGGAQDYVVAQCHMVTRKLFQEAGYSCASQPAAVKLAQEVRLRCKQMLRNADGYEIWPNY